MLEKIMIAGGLGFVGKNLIEYFKDKYKLVVLDIVKNSYSNEIDYYRVGNDMAGQFSAILKNEKPDYIINLISTVSAERDVELLEEHLQSNFKVFIDLYQACTNLKSLKLFINFGSAEEYGPIKTPFHESDREFPLSPYAVVKQLTTNTAIMLHKNWGFPVCVVRPGNLFGKYQNEKKFIPYILGELSKGNKVELSPGLQKRDFISIDDFVPIIHEVLKRYKGFEGEIVNISSSKMYSIKYIVEHCKHKLHSSSEIIYGSKQYRENEMMEFQCSIEKLEKILGYKIDIDPIEGLNHYIDRNFL